MQEQRLPRGYVIVVVMGVVLLVLAGLMVVAVSGAERQRGEVSGHE